MSKLSSYIRYALEISFVTYFLSRVVYRIADIEFFSYVCIGSAVIFIIAFISGLVHDLITREKPLWRIFITYILPLLILASLFFLIFSDVS